MPAWCSGHHDRPYWPSSLKILGISLMKRYENKVARDTTATMLPEVFFARGVTARLGNFVMQPKEILDILSEGG
jgi:uncharacterized protein (DUF4213/DUF364 family)